MKKLEPGRCQTFSDEGLVEGILGQEIHRAFQVPANPEHEGPAGGWPCYLTPEQRLSSTAIPRYVVATQRCVAQSTRDSAAAKEAMIKKEGRNINSGCDSGLGTEWNIAK